MPQQKDFTGFPNRIEIEQDLLHAPEYPDSAFMVFKFDVEMIFGTKGRVPVVITIDGQKFKRSLARYAGEYMMVFNSELREKTGYKAGDTIRMTIERDFEERKVVIPNDLHDALQNANVIDAWEKYSYSHQKEDLNWIEEAKKPETRLRRIEKLIKILGG